MKKEEKEMAERKKKEDAEAKINEKIYKETEKKLFAILKSCMKIEKSIESAKEDLSLQADFCLEKVYTWFDINENGVIDKVEFAKGLANIGLKMGAADVNAFYRRFDIDGDAKLSFQEFALALTPLN
jgi:hypothetical protein